MSEEKPTLERQSSESLKIPERRVVVKDVSDLPTSYSTTPGGTMFSTTPGGTLRSDVLNRAHHSHDYMKSSMYLIAKRVNRK